MEVVGETHHFRKPPHVSLVGGFKDFLFSPLPGEMIQFDLYFSGGLKPPTYITCYIIPSITCYIIPFLVGNPY